MESFVVASGSDKPVPNVIGRRFKLVQDYFGHKEAVVVEAVGRNAFGVPMYGCHIDGYVNPYRPSEQITVDFAANEFVWEQGEAYQEQADKGFAWLSEIIGQQS